jgi:hydrophobic/amphiphilic exporter-1 (mainly G- bacteria), HAE1 family
MFIRFFIGRPVFAAVCALLIVLAGAVSIPTLPVSLFPQLAPPQVNVASTYQGASAEIVESSVTTPLEQQINGVEGMRYMTSTSGNDGSSNISVVFDLSRNLDLAAVDVANRVNIAEPRLPSTVRTTGVTVTKASTAFVLAAGLYAPGGQYSNLFISNYADLYIRDTLRRVQGVADVRIFGERRYSMRLWLDPARLAGRGISATDVLSALREQNADIAAGQVGEPPMNAAQTYQISVNAHGRLRSPEEFRNIVLKTGEDGALIRVGDVANIELGAEDYSSTLRFLGHEAVGIGVLQLPTANALDVDRAVRRELARLAHRFPPGLTYEIAFDTTTVIGESIREVLIALAAAIALVIAVIFLFLQRWQSTLIPAVTIPVSLIGTFAFVKLFGFSINTLTLFGLTLATGLVVDDAIVVLENIERHMEEKRIDARTAAPIAMSEVVGAVMATSIVLIAVFVPVALFPGTTGRIYQQFALTIAFSIAISAFNALTLSPALSALVLKPKPERKAKPFQLFDRALAAAYRRYERALHGLMDRKWLTVGAFVAALLLTAWVYTRVPRAFLPDEDQGYIIINVQSPEGASVAYTSDVVSQIEKEIAGAPEIAAGFAVLGFSFSGNASNKATVFAAMKPQGERKGSEHSSMAVLARLRGPLGSIPGAVVVPFLPPSIQGVGSFGGFQFELQDEGSNSFFDIARATAELVAAGNQRPELRGVFSSFNASSPQYRLEVDRQKAKSMQLDVSAITDAIEAYMGSVYVNDFEMNNRSYRVYVQADPQFRANPRDLGRYYARARTGAMLPLDGLLTLTETSTPSVISHFNLLRSAELNGAAAPGVSSGRALSTMGELASSILPAGMTYSWAGISLEQVQAGGQALLVFGLGILVVFLVLSAQYESFALPLLIMTAVPLAVLGGLLAVWVRGLSNDVYAQIGLVMLVGLATKNAILIVEFSEQLRAKGRSATEAAVEAARIRLRPILMTSFAFILGVLPLVFASGAGANSRHSLGTTVFGGMLVSTLLNLFLIPVLYVAYQSIRARLHARRSARRTA